MLPATTKQRMICFLLQTRVVGFQRTSSSTGTAVPSLGSLGFPAILCFVLVRHRVAEPSAQLQKGFARMADFLGERRQREASVMCVFPLWLDQDTCPQGTRCEVLCSW